MRVKGKKERVTEEFCLRNFLELIEKYPEIPLNVIVDPMLQIFGNRLKGERKHGG